LPTLFVFIRKIRGSNIQRMSIQAGLAHWFSTDSGCLWLGFFKNQRNATAAGFDEVDSELGRCIVVHDAGLRGKPRLHCTVGPKRQQAVVEYLTVAGLGSFIQKRVVDKVVHCGSPFWQREEKGCHDLCGDPEPQR